MSAKAPRRVGVTGGIGSGKSTVCRVFETLGVPVFHADDEGRALLNEEAPARQAVIDAFGAGLYASGQLDRKALGGIVFNDPTALAKLNAIVHPAVRERFNTWCAKQNGAAYAVMEAAILAETGGDKAMDHLVVVTAPEELRIQRVMARDGVAEEEVRARMRNQSDDVLRNAKADTVIINDDRTMVIPQVLALHEKLGGSEAGAVLRNMPLSMVTLIFGVLSVPLAFARHMVSLAVVMALLAIAFHLWGRWKSHKKIYAPGRLRRSRLGFITACIGLVCAIVMWVLWATSILLEK